MPSILDRAGKTRFNRRVKLFQSLENRVIFCLFVLLKGVFPSLSYAAPLQILYEYQSISKESPSMLQSMMGASAEASVTLQSKSLATLTIEQLAKKKQQDLLETDPESGTKSRFKGVSLSALVDQSAADLTADDRSHIDLVMLKSRSGKLVLMPRDFLVKYPTIQLALQKDGKTMSEEAPRVILPATSNARMQKEALLLDSLFLSGLSEVILTSYQYHYSDLYLKKRTDPAAMRGEKLFMQNCVGCHALPEKLTKLSDEGHPAVPGATKLKSMLDKKQIRSLMSYLDAFHTQKTTASNR